MSDFLHKKCVIIGASHAGVNFAFALRKEGWKGTIVLIDKDPTMPYHRPPLSKAYLKGNGAVELSLLKSPQSYENNNITLKLGVAVDSIDRLHKNIILHSEEIEDYDILVLATGARPILPKIPGIETAKNIFPLRTTQDVMHIKNAFHSSDKKRVVIIGGGYIGLETAASIKQLGATEVTVLERENRVLARVTAPEMSKYFEELHESRDVHIATNKNVTGITSKDGVNVISCKDGSEYLADIAIIGVGVRVNQELAENTGLLIENGIKVDATARTSDENIYAIGDCTFHYNPHFNRFIRLESVQNASDQAKVAAANICGNIKSYNTIPWFWSDQYEVKLQMVGLADGYTQTVLRKEKEHQFSLWYFKNEELLAVDAVNSPKSYVLGTKFIKENKKIDIARLADTDIPLKPTELLID